MEHGITARVLGGAFELTCVAIERSAPLVIATHKVVVKRVLVPAGMLALTGAVHVFAAILDPKALIRK